MKSIVIENVGPHELLEIPLEDGGGVTVLRGRNDKGKSVGLAAVSALAGGKDKLSVRRDAPPGTKGTVEGCGVELTVYKSQRTKGVAEFEVLSDDFSIEDIVEPGIKDCIAADAKRIKALLRVAGAEIEPKEFYKMVGGEDGYVAAVGPDGETDPVVVSSRIRNYLHKQAVTLEKEADALGNKAEGLKHAYDGVDVSGEDDVTTLQQTLEEAVSKHSRTKSKRESYLAAVSQQADAMAQLAAAEKEYEPYSEAKATAAMEDAITVFESADAQVIALKAQLEKALKAYGEAEQRVGMAKENLARAKQGAEAIARLRSVVEAATPKEVSEEDVQQAKEAIDKARAAVEAGARVRDAKKQLEAAADMQKQSKRLSKEAEKCRETAANVNSVLNKAVEKLGVGLSVANERLIIDRDGTLKLFDEISMGARRKVALDIAIDAIGTTGLIPLDQSAWESLDGIARKEIYDHLKERGVNMITAACSTDEKVIAEVYDPN